MSFLLTISNQIAPDKLKQTQTAKEASAEALKRQNEQHDLFKQAFAALDDHYSPKPKPVVPKRLTTQTTEADTDGPPPLNTEELMKWADRRAARRYFKWAREEGAKKTKAAAADAPPKVVHKLTKANVPVQKPKNAQDLVSYENPHTKERSSNWKEDSFLCLGGRKLVPEGSLENLNFTSPISAAFVGVSSSFVKLTVDQQEDGDDHFYVDLSRSKEKDWLAITHDHYTVRRYIPEALSKEEALSKIVSSSLLAAKVVMFSREHGVIVAYSDEITDHGQGSTVERLPKRNVEIQFTYPGSDEFVRVNTMTEPANAIFGENTFSAFRYARSAKGSHVYSTCYLPHCGHVMARTVSSVVIRSGSSLPRLKRSGSLARLQEFAKVEIHPSASNFDLTIKIGEFFKFNFSNNSEPSKAIGSVGNSDSLELISTADIVKAFQERMKVVTSHLTTLEPAQHEIIASFVYDLMWIK